jgi:DNA replication protein DnaC
VSETKTALEVASIKQSCQRLHLPTIASQSARLAEQAVKERQSHLSYLDALLEAEVEERERNVVRRRIKEAHFPKVKTLEEFDFETASHISDGNKEALMCSAKRATFCANPGFAVSGRGRTGP